MTRSLNQSPNAASPRVGRVAAIQERPDGGLAILVAETGGSSFAITDSVRLDAAQAAETLKSKKVDLVLRLVPAVETVCRVLPAPEIAAAERSSVADALLLQAESELPAILPWHRRSAGMFRLGGQQAVLLTGWVNSSSKAIDASPLSSIPEVWVAEIAALGALAHAAGTGAAVGLADRSSATLSLLALGSKRPIGRVLRIAAADSGWDEAIRAAWSETATAAGAAVACAQTDGLLMELPGTVRLGGATRDREWISRNGLAFGAIALYADADAAVSSLVGLTPFEPRRAMPFAHRAIDWLSRPRNAAIVAAACVGALLFSPWVAAEARYAMLRSEAGAIDELDQRLNVADRRAEFYKLLSEKRWPMTKLLADVAGAAPVGITMESIELLQGDAINIRATAQTSELVSAFRKNLADTMVFRDVATPTIEATADGVKFQLQTKLTASGAITTSKPINDFAAETLSQRLYGANADTSAGWYEDTDRGSDRRSDDRRSSSSRERESSSRSPARTERPAAATDAPTIPPPLSDAEIAAMDRGTAMKEWGVRKKASTQPGLDPAEKDRLAIEAEKCKARMQAATGGGA